MIAAAPRLHVLAAGATQALVVELADPFRATAGLEIAGSFGAVGAMRERLLSGTAADVVVLSREMIADLEREGHVLQGSAHDIGAVATGIAVRDGEPAPDVSSRSALKAAMEAAGALFMPDPQKATAGIHLARLMREMGLSPEAPRVRAYANGQAAMTAMAIACDVSRPLGFTQATEIVATPGVSYVGPLPRGCELTTMYTAAVAARSPASEPARRLIEMMTGPASAELRERLGFQG